LLDSTLDIIAAQQVDAASALAQAGEQQAVMLEQIEDELFAQRATDVRDVVNRAITALRGQNVAAHDLSILQQPVILVARDLTPSDTAKMRPETVLGICTTQGGPTAHAAILARALGIPAIAGLNEAALDSIHAGDELALDATQGLLYYQPDEQTRARFMQQVALQQQRMAAQKAARKAQPILTINGRHIRFYANIGSEAEAEAARQWGAEGVGLLRTEFLFGDAATLPGENEQRQRYARIFQAFKGQGPQASGPIIARTLDAGADKPMPALENVIGKMAEMNPALGLRGIRIHLAYQDLLQQQLRALLLAAADTQIELHIMFPMITTVEELLTVRAIFERVHTEVRQQHSDVPERVPLGIMVEVPSAALMARELAQIADFFSIGANDLTQYTLACDRTNASVASLYNPMQPAVLRLIKQTAEAGQQAGKLVAVCGEMAGDPRLAPVLVGLGVDELSMTPTALPAVQEILRRKPARDIMQLAERILSLQTLEEVEQACTEFTQ
jgi:phosphoenolpyruvate-protein phosphotransferase